MIRILREIWRDLGRSILVGERYEKNMRGITLVALLIVTFILQSLCNGFSRKTTNRGLLTRRHHTGRKEGIL